MEATIPETPAETPETVLLTVDKSERDQIKVRESIFKDKEYIDIRIFNKKRDGNIVPTKKGVTLPKETMRELVKSMYKMKI